MPVQVAADIEADIDAGALAPDTRLPSESELATQYGVARVSVRRAIEKLRERGEGRHGSRPGNLRQPRSQIPDRRLNLFAPVRTC